MAMDEHMQHEVAHVKLNKAMTQVYLDMTNALDAGEVGLTLNSIELFDAQDESAELIAGIGECYQGGVGVVMEKISDTEVTVTATLDGSSQTMTFEQSRDDLEMMLMQADFQIGLAEMFAAEEEGAL